MKDMHDEHVSTKLEGISRIRDGYSVESPMVVETERRVSSDVSAFEAGIQIRMIADGEDDHHAIVGPETCFIQSRISIPFHQKSGNGMRLPQIIRHHGPSDRSSKILAQTCELKRPQVRRSVLPQMCTSARRTGGFITIDFRDPRFTLFSGLIPSPQLPGSAKQLNL
jgi:hypothetical protein